MVIGSLSSRRGGSRSSESHWSWNARTISVSRMGNESDSMGGLQSLVKREIKAVNIVRVLVVSLLAITCAVSASVTYKVSKKVQEDFFHREFKAVSSAIRGIFLTSLTQTLASGTSLASQLTLEAKRQGNPDFFFFPDFHQVVAPARVFHRYTGIAWAPYISNETQRTEFEAFISARSEENESIYDSQCSLCKTGTSLSEEAKKTFVNVEGFGTFNCHVISIFMSTNNLNHEECAFSLSQASGKCDCVVNENYSISDPDGLDNNGVFGRIFALNESFKKVVDPGPGPYSPVIQSSPPPSETYLYNFHNDLWADQAISVAVNTSMPAASIWEPRNESEGLWQLVYSNNPVLGDKISEGVISGGFFFPVFHPADENLVIGTLTTIIQLNYIFQSSLPKESPTLVIVFDNSFGQSYSYTVNQNGALDLMGEGDLHDRRYSHMVADSSYDTFDDIMRSRAGTNPSGQQKEIIGNQENVKYKLRVYPSSSTKDNFKSSDESVWLTLMVVLIFALTASLFLFYDYFVAKLQKKIMQNAEETNRIVSNLFPSRIRAKLIGRNTAAVNTREPAKVLLQSFLSSSHEPESHTASLPDDPLAELFLSTTIMFADIEGFTAWSSEREPSQVFALLESLYQAFDKVANQLGIFKVETIGDCYVAVCGLPEPREEHAVVMARFAHSCMLVMSRLTKELEAKLGPNTASLSMRFGLHSGPVLAGVLRGEKSRFQLFGDTMNTASRIESSGEINRIHISKATASLIKRAGKGHWVTKRDEVVTLKGKGTVETFWVNPIWVNPMTSHARRIPVVNSQVSYPPLSILTPSMQDSPSPCLEEYEKLVDWNTNLILQQLKSIIAYRQSDHDHDQKPRRFRASFLRSDVKVIDKTAPKCFEGKASIMDEVSDIIKVANFNSKARSYNADEVELPGMIHEQLRVFVSRIASMYRNVPFHNFEHASHVSLSANKLLKRIITPESAFLDSESSQNSTASKEAPLMDEKIHNMTFGISSDPLMHLAILFATLIHDVDHTGVANKDLVRLQTETAVSYGGKCVAEQHSVKIAWDTLMCDEFNELRGYMYRNEEEATRFRELVVNAVIATDIADKELQALRKNRWHKAFQPAVDDGLDESTESLTRNVDRKATIVFEHIIQASDVAHTMQHWKVYQCWNEHLFEEMYLAWISGYSDEDPAPGWYKGEIGFFDFYIIPLARKLERCGIFGVSSDEYLNYALENRNEWEKKGEEIVEQFVEKYRRKYSTRRR